MCHPSWTSHDRGLVCVFKRGTSTYMFSEVSSTTVLPNFDVSKYILSPLPGVKDRGLLLRGPNMLSLFSLGSIVHHSIRSRNATTFQENLCPSSGAWCTPFSLLGDYMLPPYGVKRMSSSLVKVLSSTLGVYFHCVSWVSWELLILLQ